MRQKGSKQKTTRENTLARLAQSLHSLIPALIAELIDVSDHSLVGQYKNLTREKAKVKTSPGARAFTGARQTAKTPRPTIGAASFWPHCDTVGLAGLLN